MRIASENAENFGEHVIEQSGQTEGDGNHHEQHDDRLRDERQPDDPQFHPVPPRRDRIHALTLTVRHTDNSQRSTGQQWTAGSSAPMIDR